MAAIYVSEDLKTAIAMGAGFAEDVEFDGIPMRRVSPEWLEWLRKNHRGTLEDARELGELLKRHPQEEWHSQKDVLPEQSKYEWRSEDDERWESSNGVVDTGSSETIGRNDENDTSNDEARRHSVLHLWSEKEDPGSSTRRVYA